MTARDLRSDIKTPLTELEGKRDARVLVIEDSEFDLNILLELITDYVEVRAVMSGQEAMRILKEDSFDLILLDILLPDTSGFDLLQEFRTLPSLAETPVIIISALSDPTSEEKGLKLGAADFISKPFHPAIIHARVQNQISLSQATRELRKANEKLALLAAIDPLTNLFNRRQFISLVSDRLEADALQTNPECCFMMLDLDHFKLINDAHGHDAGDIVLRVISKAWNDTLRPGDILGRVGGEEFAVFLPNTSLENGLMVAERLRKIAAKTPVVIEQKKISVTSSIGMIYCAIPTAEYSQLYKLADHTLYDAKAFGRNCIKYTQLA